MWLLYATQYSGRSDVGGKGDRSYVDALAKCADLEYVISVATYWTGGCGSPSTDD